MSTFAVRTPYLLPGRPDAWIIPGLVGELALCLTQASIDFAIAMLGLIGCVSLVTQAIADVAWPNGIASPIGLSSLLVAPSGAGKSLVMRLLTDPIHRIVQELARGRPAEWPKPQFFVEDASREALVLQLHEWKVVGLFSDEAGQLRSLLKSSAPTLAKLLDGAPLHHSRVSRGRIELLDHRVTMLGMLQPGVFESNKGILGASRGGVGLLNRFLFAKARSMPDQHLLSSLHVPPLLLARYETRLHALLDQSVAAVGLNKARPTLQLHPVAAQRLINAAYEVKTSVPPSTSAECGEYVARHAQRVLRLAAALHVFEHGAAGEVQLESVEAAHQLGLWSINEFLEMTCAPPPPSQAELDATTLEQALIRTAQMHGWQLKLSALRRMSPNIGLTKARFERALPLLAASGAITLYMQGREDFVDLSSLPRRFPLQR